MATSKNHRKSLSFRAQILRQTRNGAYPAQIARNLEKSESLLSYHIKQARNAGYLRKIYRSNFICLEVTPKGQKFLDQYSRKGAQQYPRIKLENLCFKAEISYLPPKHDFLDFRKVQMRNWTQYSGRVNSVRVHINLAKKPSAEFFASNVDGDSISEVSNAANQECLLASIELCNLTGIKFGPLKQAGKPEYAIYDPIAREYCKEFGQVTVEGLGKLNASKPRRIGEFEFYDPRSAAQYMQMPQQIESIQRTLNDLGVKIDCVEKAVAGHNPQGESVVRHETIAEKKIFSEWQRQSPTLNIRFDSNTVFGSPHLGLRDILLGQLCNSNGKYFAENVEVRESHHP